MLRYFDSTLRRRIAPVLLLVGLIVVGHVASNEIPRDQEVHFLLSDTQRNADRIEISYTFEGEPMSGLTLTFAGKVPAEVSHTPSLKPGRYDVRIELSGAKYGSERLQRTLTVPTEPRARIRLEEPFAR